MPCALRDKAYIEDMNNELTNFAAAIKIAASRCNGIKHGDRKLVEACGIKGRFFPRSDAKLWHKQLMAVSKAGLVRTLRDGDCLFVVA